MPPRSTTTATTTAMTTTQLPTPCLNPTPPIASVTQHFHATTALPTQALTTKQKNKPVTTTTTNTTRPPPTTNRVYTFEICGDRPDNPHHIASAETNTNSNKSLNFHPLLLSSNRHNHHNHHHIALSSSSSNTDSSSSTSSSSSATSPTCCDEPSKFNEKNNNNNNSNSNLPTHSSVQHLSRQNRMIFNLEPSSACFASTQPPPPGEVNLPSLLPDTKNINLTSGAAAAAAPEVSGRSRNNTNDKKSLSTVKKQHLAIVNIKPSSYVQQSHILLQHTTTAIAQQQRAAPIRTQLLRRRDLLGLGSGLVQIYGGERETESSSSVKNLSVITEEDVSFMSDTASSSTTLIENSEITEATVTEEKNRQQIMTIEKGKTQPKRLIETQIKEENEEELEDERRETSFLNKSPSFSSSLSSTELSSDESTPVTTLSSSSVNMTAVETYSNVSTGNNESSKNKIYKVNSSTFNEPVVFGASLVHQQEEDDDDCIIYL